MKTKHWKNDDNEADSPRNKPINRSKELKITEDRLIKDGDVPGVNGLISWAEMQATYRLLIVHEMNHFTDVLGWRYTTVDANSTTRWRRQLLGTAQRSATINAVITIAIRLRYDYDPTTTYRACLFPFDASKKMNMSIFRRSRIAVESNA